MDEGGGELQFKGRLRRTARPAAAASSLVILQGCSRGILNPVGPVGSAEKEILINSTAIMLAIIIPTIIATVAIAWWFRSGNKKAKYRPDWEYSGAIELVVWSVPALTIMLLGGIAWIGSHDLEPSRPLKSSVPPIRVDVVSLDWKWLFLYPDQGIATVNQLVIPAGTPVNFRLTSGTVWNVFFIPQMGTMIYTMPRMTTRLNLEADRPGTYEGISAHFSGDGFPGMRFAVHAVPAAQFSAWASAAHSEPTLDAQTFNQLQRPSSYVKPLTYGSVVPNLFESLVANHNPSASSLASSSIAKNASLQPAIGPHHVR